jgi:H+/Cl- antiporter ClcA
VPRALKLIGQWVVLGAGVGIVCGLASALFLFLLEHATAFRTAHEPIVYALPLLGLAMGLVLHRFGKPIEGGNNLILETLHAGAEELPLRMAPMVLLGTVATHLFGGSAGREGTAVQMGGSLADFIAHRLGVTPEVRRGLLAAGIAGGFGSVFGTPFAGMVFGIEVLTIGRVELEALLPALIASVVGDAVTRGVGIVHTAYPHPAALALTPWVGAKWLVVALAVAATATLFIELTQALKALLATRIPWLPLRMMLGGLAVVGLWRLSGTSDFLGLGVPTIVRAFSDPSLAPYAFLAKLLFTAVTLAAGFLGGEVTPLFFVGAALGNVLAPVLGIPLPLCAGVCLAGVFAAAANTPLALILMAVELLGVGTLPHVAIVVLVAFLLTGHRGIYPAQRVARLKHGRKVEPVKRLRELG